jgi:hypothetical protein
MTSIIPYIWAVVFGFVYLLSILFFVLTILKIRSVKIPKEAEKYAPYIAVLVIFSSSIIGFVAQTLMGKFIGFLFPSNILSVSDEMSRIQSVPETLRIFSNNTYSALQLVRHLFLATILLGVSLKIWIPIEKIRYKKYIPIFCWSLSLIFLLTYYFLRLDLMQFDQYIKATFLTPQ